MRIACWITKATNTGSEYIILIAFAQQQWLCERASKLSMVIHDTISTNVRLHRTRLVGAENCTQCGRQDTMLHRLTERGAGKEIWEWIRIQIARIQSMDPRRIPTEWLVRPCFKTWSRQRHQAILWFLVHMVVYQENQRRTLSVVDYTGFMRWTRWKTYQCSNRIKFVGDYLELF
jgi:hypothetical protein